MPGTCRGWHTRGQGWAVLWGHPGGWWPGGGPAKPFPSAVTLHLPVTTQGRKRKGNCAEHPKPAHCREAGGGATGRRQRRDQGQAENL